MILIDNNKSFHEIIFHLFNKINKSYIYFAIPWQKKNRQKSSEIFNGHYLKLFKTIINVRFLK